MRAPAVILTTRDRANARVFAVGILGCTLALVAGAVTTTDQGVLVAGALAALALCGAAIVVYVRDPVLALIWLWLFEVFNAPLSAIFGYFSSTGQAIRQGDEVLVLLFVSLTLWRTLRTNTRIPPLRFILPGVGVALFGVLGAILHSVPFTVTVVGALLGLKLWIMVGITLLLPWKIGDFARVYNALTRVGMLVAILGVVDYLTNAAVSRALHTSTFNFQSNVYRGNSVHSILAQPGEYSLFMSLLFALTFTRFATKRSKSDLALALLFAGSVMLSLRLKGFLSVAAVMIIVALAQEAMHNRSAITVLLVSSLLFVGGYSLEGAVIAKQFSLYASSETTARARLYATGERIAVDNFPLGTGFGRFASYPSRLYYSPIYSQYELSSVYGLSQRFPNFIDDTSWPSVIGETGYAGLLTYLIGLVLLTLAIVRRLRTAPAAMKWVPLAALCAIAVLLIDSLGDPTLFDWLATTGFALVLGPALIATRPTSEASRGGTPIESG